VIVLGKEIRYYRGQHQVRVVTLSEGYWIIESLEEFEDTIDGQRVLVKVGEQRIVPPSLVFKQKSFPPPIVKEHTYELQMEKKLKRLVTKEERAKKKQIF
jgi:hypothetical protein